MITPRFIKVPVFDPNSPDKPVQAWINPSHIVHLEDRGNYVAAFVGAGGGSYHVLLPFEEFMRTIDPEWHG